MPEPKSSSSSAMKAIAVIIGWLCLESMRSQLPPDDGNAIFNTFDWVTKIAGLAAAVAIWNQSSRMLIVYFTWFVLLLIRTGWHDAQLEGEAWSRVAGVAVQAILWGAVGVLIHRDQRELTRPQS
jgi:hypothetical protein